MWTVRSRSSAKAVPVALSRLQTNPCAVAGCKETLYTLEYPAAFMLRNFPTHLTDPNNANLRFYHHRCGHVSNTDIQQETSLVCGKCSVKNEEPRYEELDSRAVSDCDTYPDTFPQNVGKVLACSKCKRLETGSELRHQSFLRDALMPGIMRSIWAIPLLLAIALMGMSVAGILYTTFGVDIRLDTSTGYIINDAFFIAFSFLVVYAGRQVWLWSIDRRARGTHGGTSVAEVAAYIASGASLPVMGQTVKWFIPILLFAGVQPFLLLLSKATSDVQMFAIPERTRDVNIFGMGGCDSLRCLMVSNDLFVNITRENVLNNGPLRFAAAFGDMFVMPMWPGFGALARDQDVDAWHDFGEIHLKGLLGVGYQVQCYKVDYNSDISYLKDKNDTKFFSDPQIALAVKVNGTDKGPQHTITLESIQKSPNRVDECIISMQHVTADVVWRADTFGTYVKEVTSAQPTNASFHPRLFEYAIPLNLTFANTLTWYLSDYLARHGDVGYLKTITNIAHAYAQTNIMRSATDGASIFEPQQLTQQQVYLAVSKFSIVKAFGYTIFSTGLILSVCLFTIATTWKPYLTGGLFQWLVLFGCDRNKLSGWCAPSWVDSMFTYSRIKNIGSGNTDNLYLRADRNVATVQVKTGRECRTVVASHLYLTDEVEEGWVVEDIFDRVYAGTRLKKVDDEVVVR
ncbi:hypothetical protein HK104_004135 [Borealophlyctis nickersoniae]|nr:hypothetical protein HK104_004135 [Borealophlyctis nickersoniae]